MSDTVTTTWNHFIERYALSDRQSNQFRKYYELIVSTNDIHNLTAITDLKHVIADHFEDSLALCSFVDCSQLSMLADIGTGAGFPALPLKIAFPHIKIILIEVNQKKVWFLEKVIEELELTHVTICDLDWRTFLRKTDYPIDLFCARASLSQEELVRLFKPSSPYKNAELVYWASAQWKPTLGTKPFIKRDMPYTIDSKKRRLIFLSN